MCARVAKPKAFAFLFVFLGSALGAIIPTASRQDACSLGTFCANTNQYCATSGSAGVCTDIPYDSIVDPSTTTQTTAAFSIIMATDVQYYYKTCKNEPLDDCIYTITPSPTATEKRALLIAAAAKQVECIDHLINDNIHSNVKAIFNGGDITNTGAESELNGFKRDFHNPVALLGLPMVVVLGNHDYNSNYPDDSRKRMINFLEESIETLATDHAIRSIDFQTTGVLFNVARNEDVKYTTGSFCFSIEINDYIFIVLHWATAINGGEFIDTFEAADSSGYTEIFDITSAETWLTQELADASTEGKKVILVPHSYRGLKKFVSTTSMGPTIKQSTVEAVICGHDHDQWGFFENWQVGGGTPRDVPVYYAGSTTYQRLIAVDFQAGGAGLSAVTPYDSSTGSACVATSDDNVTR